VTLAASREAAPIAAAQLTAIMLAPAETAQDLSQRLADPRYAVAALGPGAGVGAPMRAMAGAALASGAAVVLDADALTSFEGQSEALFGAIRGRTASVVLTPHEGEFRRLFGVVDGSKLERARAAAARSGAVVVLKGADTTVASPDGRAALLDFDAPYLATAGSGDVLAGFVTGILAQGAPAFEAACAAVWLHATLGRRAGPGLIAEDLPEALPALLREIFQPYSVDEAAARAAPGAGA
jgi:NAD(P)H-hydrate epimerase